MQEVKELFERLKEFFRNYEFIDFAIVFGSYAKNKAFPISDIDIAIHTSKELELLEIGEIISKLEKITQKDIDLVILNNLYKKEPILAYNIVSEGVSIFCRDKEKLADFKTKCFLWFFDHQPLYEMVNKALIKRIREGNFARKNIRKN